MMIYVGWFVAGVLIGGGTALFVTCIWAFVLTCRAIVQEDRS